MAGYLQRKFVGQYRVKAEYDLSTNDFPRLDNGNLDPSFDDLYIECANKIKIKHGGGNVLSCYIPSKPRGMNILRSIYQDKVGSKLPSDQGRYLENLCSKLVENEVLISAEVLDYEVIFEFKSDMIDYIAKLVKARTSGASISPFSLKNLPKAPYKIPGKDMELYKDATSSLPTKTIVLQGQERTMVDGMIVKQLNSQFDEIIIKSQSKDFDINKDRKIKCLKGKEYIHSMGMWDEYCEFLRNASKEIES